MRLSIPAVVALLAVLTSAPARAQRPGTLEFGGFGRFTRFDPSLGFDHAFGGGGLIGIFVAQGFAIEATAASVSTNGPQNASVHLVPFHARLLYARPAADRYAVLLGAGYVHNRYNNPSQVWEDGASGLLGVRVDLGKQLSARLEAIADYLPSPLNGSAAATDNWNFTIQAGLSAQLGRSAVKDSDHDGVVDGVDSCPKTPKGEAVDGRGCPLPKDADADGVVDPVDRCPSTPPGDTVDLSGCSLPKDSDGDGVADGSDRCPNSPAGQKVDAAGCPPDSDGDGVVDPDDQCSNTPAGEKVDARGCPPPKDSDGDGVMDPADRCPGTRVGERVDATGCPVLFTGVQRTLVLLGVSFETGSAALSPQSRGNLDRVAASLTAHPAQRVEVAGYTDSQGNSITNLRLSQARAEAVRLYLIEKGVAPPQLTARGYGARGAIDTNATAAGRARNRRVELHRLN